MESVQINHIGILRLLLATFFLMLLVAVFIIPVHAANMRVDQGGNVYVGQHVDISGVVGWRDANGDYWVGYYGRSGTEWDPQYLIKLSSKKQMADFYIDPAIFSQRLGMWQQFSGNTTERHGNVNAFNVMTEADYNARLGNGTLNVTPEQKPLNDVPAPIVPPKRFDSDYQVAYGDSFSLTVVNSTQPIRFWLFGRINSIYNRSFSTSRVYLNPEDIQNLESGTYTAMVISPGKNTIFEEGFYRYVDVQNSKTIEKLVSPWAAVKPVDVYGLSPMLVYPKVKEFMSSAASQGWNDDVVTTFTLTVSPPTIDMVSVDPNYMGGLDVLDIRGYTNIAKGSEISFVMDKENQTPAYIRTHTSTANVSEDNPRFWRYFQCVIPIDYNSMPVGPHFITATSQYGASQTIPYHVYDLPEGSERPKDTIKYASGDQFLDPVIVTVTVTVPPKVIEKVVHVAVTPDPAEVAAITKRNADAAAAYWWTNAIFFLIVGAVTIVVGMYAVSVIRRARVKT